MGSMADEPMTLPVSPKPPEDPSGHHEIVKNPVSKKFWTLRNAVGLILTALIPVGTSKVIDAVAFFETMDERLAHLEANDSSSEAIWKAISDIRHDGVEARIKYEAAMLLFNREFQARFPNMEGPKTAVQPKPNPSEVPVQPPLLPPDPIKPPVAPKDPKDPKPLILPDEWGSLIAPPKVGARYIVDPEKKKAMAEALGVTEKELEEILKSEPAYKQFRESYEKRFPGVQQKK